MSHLHFHLTDERKMCWRVLSLPHHHRISRRFYGNDWRVAAKIFWQMDFFSITTFDYIWFSLSSSSSYFFEFNSWFFSPLLFRVVFSSQSNWRVNLNFKCSSFYHHHHYDYNNAEIAMKKIVFTPKPRPVLLEERRPINWHSLARKKQTVTTLSSNPIFLLSKVKNHGQHEQPPNGVTGQSDHRSGNAPPWPAASSSPTFCRSLCLAQRGPHLGGLRRRLLPLLLLIHIIILIFNFRFFTFFSSFLLPRRPPGRVHLLSAAVHAKRLLAAGGVSPGGSHSFRLLLLLLIIFFSGRYFRWHLHPPAAAAAASLAGAPRGGQLPLPNAGGGHLLRHRLRRLHRQPLRAAHSLLWAAKEPPAESLPLQPRLQRHHLQHLQHSLHLHHAHLQHLVAARVPLPAHQLRPGAGAHGRLLHAHRHRHWKVSLKRVIGGGGNWYENESEFISFYNLHWQ